MRTYTRLAREQRYQTYALLKAGHNQTDIADLIQVHKSTINWELRRNRGLKGYRHKQADQFALSRRKKARCHIEASTWILIEALIHQDWSPEQVSDWLKENNGLQIRHERITRNLRAGVYFAHPYSSWERATNENMNGLIRQYFLKKRNFATINQQEIEFVMERLYNRPRKCLGFKAPNQVFFNHSPVVATRS